MRVPTPQDLREKLRPDTLTDVSEVTEFDTNNLKHVETLEKNLLPTKEGNVISGIMHFTTVLNPGKWETV